MTDKIDVMPSLGEVTLFSGINFTMVLIGILLWYFIWVKEYGIMIPLDQISEEINLIFFNTKNFSIAVNEIFRRWKQFDRKYLLRAVGFEAYVYLIFQRRLFSLVIIISIFSLIFSLVSFLVSDNKSLFTFFLNNFSLDEHWVFHLILIAIFSFAHFRCFYMIKEEVKFLFFEKFDRMSRKKDADWLSCRTLHISGLAPNERNTSSLKRKLDIFLSDHNAGKVIDIKFIPDYKQLLELERERSQILDIRDLISKKESDFARKCFFPKVYRTKQSIDNRLNEIENKIQSACELPVYSSGHAFVCFDSLLSAYLCLRNFKENSINKLNIGIGGFFKDCFKKKTSSRDAGINDISKMNPNYISNQQGKSRATFMKFEDEDLQVAMMQPEEVQILVDLSPSPFDIIWSNVGGERGLYIIRRILCNVVIVTVLIFLTTPTALLSTLKTVDFYSLLDFTWIVKIPFGYIIKTYIPPLIILALNLFLIYLIDLSSILEKHYTHSRYQYSVFVKSFLYMIFNLFIIPGVTMTTAQSIFSVIYEKIYDIPLLLSKIYLSNTGYFFVTMLIQNGTISSLFYLLRLDEIFMNNFSAFFTFYKRYFINSNKQWHRQETDAFQFGYYYAQFLTFYTIFLVFSTTVFMVSPAVIYFFIFRHLVDFISLLNVHRHETDSSGELINSILNFSCLPVILFQLSMMSYFLVKMNYIAAGVTFAIFVFSTIYICKFNSKYIFDVYALHENLKVYEHEGDRIDYQEVNKWRNEYRHPLVIPISLDEENQYSLSFIEQSRLNRDGSGEISK